MTSTAPSAKPSPPTPTAAAAAPTPTPDHRKNCTLCTTLRDVLVRCQIDSSGTWHFVCVGSCWKRVSGGKEDGDAEHPLYRYGGMWKNKHEAVSAKKKGRKGNGEATKGKEKGSMVVDGSERVDDAVEEGEGDGEGQTQVDESARAGEVDDANDGPEEWCGARAHYTTNDRIQYSGRTWICRKTHYSQPDKPPHTAQSFWKAKARLVEE